jgi:alanyl-tRNA synthetase
MPTANEVRQQFIDFFVKQHGHTFVPSSSVVPLDDPTLLFTNAGMNQFKDVFLGTGTRPYRRAVNSQKCIRAGGKHNDLDDVGKDTYHHTFFEMLGNWSFGDYFKKEAISRAWELLTQVWGLDKGRLHATVFEGDSSEGLAPDEEAAELWRTVTDIDPSHVHLGNKKDNFWEMGETGPCGPCTEIHIDRTPGKSGGRLVNAGRPEVIEIWNLVFIQFNRGADKQLTPLPAKHVDTGMGFERITAVLQGKTSNYDTGVFAPIMNAISLLVMRNYGGKLDDLDDIAFRVIADHLRMLTFAITDGALPSNKGRGSVVRSVLRRAVRFGYQRFGLKEPFIYKLVPSLVAHMGQAYPELLRDPARVARIISEEEADFLRTVDRGLGHFEKLAYRAQHQDKQISGEEAFRLHETYGFPIDLTRQLASERVLKVDEEEFERLRLDHEKLSRESAKKQTFQVVTWPDQPEETDDSDKYDRWDETITDQIMCWVQDNEAKSNLDIPDNQQIALVLGKTNFYAAQGGQVGDIGEISSDTGKFEVQDTQKIGNSVLHIGRVTDGRLRNGQMVKLRVNSRRADIMRNHTATHLLNWALRKVLGEHVEQKGSLVDAEKTRFDFAHPLPLTDAEVAEVERLVNEKIYSDLPVMPTVMPLAEAKKIPGVRAVFGEKYPDPVRVLLIGAERPGQVTAEHSVEFCGGTHLAHTGQAGFFKIVSQEAVGKGVRRVTAVTGREAVATVQRLSGIMHDLTERFNCKPEEVAGRVDQLQEEVKKLQQQLKKGAATDLQGAADKLLAAAEAVNGAQVIVGEMPAGPEEQMRQQIDRLRQKAGSAVVILGWSDDGKVQLIAAVTDDLVKKGLHAGKLVGQVAKVVGGGGGGKPNLAQAGGKDPGKLADALQLGRQLAREQLAK